MFEYFPDFANFANLNASELIYRFLVKHAFARVAELVDAKDSKSFVPIRRAGSSPAPGTGRTKDSCTS